MGHYDVLRARIKRAESKMPANYGAVAVFCAFIGECAEGDLKPDDDGIIRVDVPEEIAAPLIRIGFRGFTE